MKLLLLALLLPGLSWGNMTLNADVTQANIKVTICNPGWTKKVRPSLRYTNFVKQQFLEAKGLSWDLASFYELDHIVPLELGGHPYSYANLQLQQWEGPDNARDKDVVETWLKRQVCAGRIPLEAAQKCVYAHWQLCKQELSK